MRCMLGYIGCSPTIFTTQRQALQQAKADEDDRCRNADAGRAWQQSHHKGRKTHDQNGDKEGIFTADKIADPSEHECAERANNKARGKRQKREDVAGCFIKHRFAIGTRDVEELRANNRSERTIKIKIIPFKYGAKR